MTKKYLLLALMASLTTFGGYANETTEDEKDPEPELFCDASDEREEEEGTLLADNEDEKEEGTLLAENEEEKEEGTLLANNEDDKEDKSTDEEEKEAIA